MIRSYGMPYSLILYMDSYIYIYPQIPFYPPSRLVWWKTAPGVRSFNAVEYEGCDQSLEELAEYWRREGPFDGMLGFSQVSCA